MVNKEPKSHGTFQLRYENGLCTQHLGEVTENPSLHCPESPHTQCTFNSEAEKLSKPFVLHNVVNKWGRATFLCLHRESNLQIGGTK